MEQVKQTAVEWFIEQLLESNLIEKNGKTLKLIGQAKEMEKEQIEDAYDAGLFDGSMDDVNNRMHKEYYNETYGGNK
jgi:hypothetical protein